MFKLNETVRIVGEAKGSINEFARVTQISDEGYHVSNINMPYVGSINAWMHEVELGKI